MDRFGVVGVGVVVGVTVWPFAPLGLEPAFGLLLVALSALLRWPGDPAGFLAGVALGLVTTTSVPEGPWMRGPVALVGTVVAPDGGGWAQVEVARLRAREGPWRPTSGRVLVRAPRGVRVYPGTQVALSGEAAAPHHTGPPGAPDPLRGAARAHVHTAVTAWQLARLGGDPPPARAIPPLLAALATGDRAGVTPAELDLLRRTGTAHLLAISGFHVGLLAWGVAGAARRVLALYALARPEGLPGGWGLAAGVASAVAFTFAVGAPVSAQRAATLVTLLAVARATGRHAPGLSLLGLAATAVLVADPAAVGTPSFQLSFGAVAGLVTWGPALKRLVPPDLPGPVAWFVDGLIASTAATLGTVPASAWWFQSVAPVGLVTNLFAIPWTAVVLVPAALTAAWGPEALVPPASWIGARGGEVLLAGLAWCDVEPWHPAVGPLGAALSCAVFVMPRFPSAGALLVLLGLTARPIPVHPEVWFLDVGQGAATYVVHPDGRRWLIDGGWRDEEVLAWLRRHGVTRLDRVVATHGDRDHAGGLRAVLERLDVAALQVASTDGLEEHLEVAAARGVPILDTPADRLMPEATDGLERNAASVVLDLDLGARVLLPGDIGWDEEAALAALVGPVDLLQVAHHGSRTSTHPGLLSAARPSVAVISAGRGNRYGHPAPEVLRRLRGAGVEVLRTDLHGTIRVVLADPPEVWAHAYGRGWERVAVAWGAPGAP